MLLTSEGGLGHMSFYRLIGASPLRERGETPGGKRGKKEGERGGKRGKEGERGGKREKLASME